MRHRRRFNSHDSARRRPCGVARKALELYEGLRGIGQVLEANPTRAFPTYAKVRELLHYDPVSGVFTRLVDSRTGRHKAGTRSGARAGRYSTIWIDNRPYLMHRVAWVWMTGLWPKHQIDHKNLDGHDNRWDNLREATGSQNGMNRRGHSKSGAKGVYYQTNKQKCGSTPWKVSISKNGERYHVGLFKTFGEAKAAHQAAAIALHGEYARFT